MGYYIQTPSSLQKAEQIAELSGGVIVDKPKKFSDVPVGLALIVVVDNGPFEAAAFCYDEGEFRDFTNPSDDRPKTYVVMDWDRACMLSGYFQGMKNLAT